MGARLPSTAGKKSFRGRTARAPKAPYGQPMRIVHKCSTCTVQLYNTLNECNILYSRQYKVPEIVNVLIGGPWGQKLMRLKLCKFTINNL